MKYTITLADGATVTETDIANSIKRVGRDAECGLRQIEFVLQRVLDQRAVATELDNGPKRLA